MTTDRPTLDELIAIDRDRYLTEEESLAYLTAPESSGKVPCSRYGRDSDECAPVAIELARIYGDNDGAGFSIDRLDSCMGWVVNDNDGVASLLNEYASAEFREANADLMAEIRPRQALSSGHFSTDSQMHDALNFLRINRPGDAAAIVAEFPQLDALVWSGSWVDTDATGVDPEFTSWVIDAIEATGLVWWEDGEPWAAAED